MQHIHSGLRTIFAAVLMFAAVAAFGQSRPNWETALDIQANVRGSMNGTITSLDRARNTFSINADGDSPGTPVRVILDSVTARYSGFGTGSTVLRGSAGFGAMRVGDRVKVIGTGSANQTIDGDEVVLLGRPVPSASPTPAPAPQALPPDTIEGIVRSINARDLRFVVETDQRNLYTVYGSAGTPVYFRGEAYKISNIEVGDRVRVRYESRTSDGVRARTIDVVQDATPEQVDGGRTVASVSGRITRIDARAQLIRIDIGRGREVRVDLMGARDNEGRPFRITDLQVGDRVELSGSYTSTDQFRASTIRFSDGGTSSGGDDPFEIPSRDDDDDEGDDGERAFETVVIYGTVQRSIGAANSLQVRDTSADREYEIHLVDDFIVRLKNGSYVTADQLKEGDRVVVQAFRDEDENLIAQTIRTR